MRRLRSLLRSSIGPPEADKLDKLDKLDKPDKLAGGMTMHKIILFPLLPFRANLLSFRAETRKDK